MSTAQLAARSRRRASSPPSPQTRSEERAAPRRRHASRRKSYRFSGASEPTASANGAIAEPVRAPEGDGRPRVRPEACRIDRAVDHSVWATVDVRRELERAVRGRPAHEDGEAHPAVRQPAEQVGGRPAPG